MLKFEPPKPTKSGDDAVKIWNELKLTWGEYKTVKLENNQKKMREYATKIKSLQDDLGITQAEFAELHIEKITIKK